MKPDFAGVHLAIARIMFQIGSTKQAEGDTLVSHGKEDEAQRLFSDARREFEEAVEELRAELRVDQKNIQALGDLGYAYANLERFDEAIATWEEVLKIDPRQAKAHFNLGLAYISKDKLDSAREHFEAFLRMSPAGPPADVARQKLREIREEGR